MEQTNIKDARFLIVDDELANVRVLERMLEGWGCLNVTGTTNPYEAPTLFGAFQPDLVLLDVMMPGLDGFGVMQQLQPLIPDGDYLPILMLTADTAEPTKHKALAVGAKDFLTKPFHMAELSLRISNLIETRLLHLQIKEQNRNLEEKVRERTTALAQSEIETVECLALAAEFRDDDTGQHTQRVGHTSALLAKCLGLPNDHMKLIRRAAQLHDVGKIGIADSILLKPGKLTPEEFSIMKEHAVIGAHILERNHTPLLQLASRIALTHHERWDGSGYPHRFSGEEIPLAGRIVAVADVFDALTHDRPYKKAWPVAEATAEIEAQSGRQFDERIVKAFLTLSHETLI
ncbi:MAG TPA: HD domain-containing phosphohydrolase [Abditibacteriaceae bacterium]|jgi:putative two-component system response regulator